MSTSAQAHNCTEGKTTSSSNFRSFPKVDKCQPCDHIYKTVYEGFQIGKATANRKGDNRCLGFRVDRKSEYIWLTYDQTERAATDIGSALIQFNESPGQNTFIGIYAANCVEWLLTALSCHFYSMIYVPLYDTLGETAIRHIINQTGLKTIFADNLKNVLTLLRLSNQATTLKRIVLMKRLATDERSKVTRKAMRKGIEIWTFQDLLVKFSKRIGQYRSFVHHPPKSKYLFQICYTSGTTGLPKGAMHTQKNVISVIQAATNLFKSILSENETVISYLPLAHIFEQVVELYSLCNGFKIGYYSGDITQLSDDLVHLKPTFMPSVPRLLNRMYDTIQSMIRQFQMSQQNSSNIEAPVNSAEHQKTMNDLLIQQVQKTLGGCVKMIFTGAAPLSPSVLQFLRRVSGAQIIEGYGQTECCGLSTCQLLNDPTVGHVGVPSNCNRIKLVDVEEMQYFVKDNVGEICIKGSNVFKGYFRDREKTHEVLDADGWLHTGDIGIWTETRQLKIIDRKKNIFKLSQGEYVTPERIENIYVQSKYVAQAFVYGNSFKSRTVSIVVPDFDVLRKYAKEHNLTENIKDLCKNQEIKDLVFNEIKALESSNGLKGFEMSKDIYLHDELFSIENNLLTPTLKSKRFELTKYFQKQIDEMYKSID